MNDLGVVLVALYRYRNFSIRIMHPLLENIVGVKPHTIFFKNREANIFDYPTHKEETLFIDLIEKLKPKIVGFSVLSPYALVASRLTRLIKNNSPSTLVIWGGIHPTISPESCIEEADMICVGEGEGAITELVECLRDGRPYQSIKNLWVRSGSHIIKNSLRPLIQDLDSIPFASWENNSYYFIDSNKITKKDPTRLVNAFWIQTSRGCPYVCSYCVNSLLRPLFKDLGPYTRRRSASNVIREIKENNKTDNICFQDEVFASDISWLDEFEIIYKKEVGLPFYVQFNPKVINSAMLDKLVCTGLDMISFGIQTGSDYIRNQIFNRPGKNSEIIKIANEIAVYNKKVMYDLILDNPYDTEQTLKETIEFLFHLPKPLCFSVFSLQYFPNYPLTKKAIKDNHILPENTTIDSLIESTPKNYLFTPRLLPYTNKQILQNIIWLVVSNRSKDSTVKYAVFGSTSGSKICLIYLNLKSIFLGKIFGVGGIVSRNYFITFLSVGIGYILKADLKTLYIKLRKYIKLMWFSP